MLQLKKWGLYILTSLCLIAIMVCVICDYVITNTLTWSLIVLLSLITGWLGFVPFFRAKNKVIKKTLIVISIIALPFLAGLSAILKLNIRSFCKISKESIFSLCPFAAYCNPFSVWDYAYCGIFCWEYFYGFRFWPISHHNNIGIKRHLLDDRFS